MIDQMDLVNPEEAQTIAAQALSRPRGTWAAMMVAATRS
jgi:hypothetical protein